MIQRAPGRRAAPRKAKAKRKKGKAPGASPGAASKKGFAPETAAKWTSARVHALGLIHCTLEEVAAVLGLGARTVDRLMKDDPAFRKAYEDGMAEGKASLRRMQYQAAMKGDKTMLIWLGKQLLGQSDQAYLGVGAGKKGDAPEEPVVFTLKIGNKSSSAEP